MEFDLCLTISGLCMFVPDEGTDGPVVHVLMPATHASHGHKGGTGVEGRDGHDHGPEDGGVVPHVVELMYDARYHQDDDVSGRDVNKPCVRIPLGGHTVVIDNLDNPGQPELEPDLAEDRVPMLNSSVNFSGVDRAHAKTPLSHAVAARVELRVGRVVDYDGVGVAQRRKFCLARPGSPCGSASGKPQLMAEHVVWWLGKYRDGVALDRIIQVTGRDGSPVPLPGGRLSPAPGADKVVNLQLLHVVPKVLSANLCRSYQFAVGGPLDATHFAMYYDLATRPSPDRYVPIEATSAGPGAEKGTLMPSVVCAIARAKFA